MFQKPQAAKRLYFDVIPRAVDDYQQFLAAYPRQDAKQRLDNPVWHIHSAIRRRPTCRSPSAAAQPGVVVERGERRDAVGLHRPLSSGRDAADASGARPAGRLCHPLLSRLREADEDIPRSRPRSSARRLQDLRDALSQLPADADGRGDPERRLRSAAASRSSTRSRRARTAAPASRSTGSTCSTRCCSARRRARASARSSRSTACRTR